MPPPSPQGRRRTAVMLALLAVAGATTVAWRVLTFSGFNNDHYIYLAAAQQMLLGEWPVRDFVDPGWPLMGAFPALARWLFGKALLVEVLLVASVLAAAAVLTLATASRLSGSLALATAVTAVEIFISPRSFGYPKIVLYAAAAWLLVRYSDRRTFGRLIGLAALTACAFLFRHDHGLYIGVGVATAVLVIHWRDGTRASLRACATWAAATALMLAPWAVAVQTQLGFSDYLRPALAFSRSEAEATLLRAWPRIDGAAPLFGRENASVILFYVFCSLPIVALVVAARRAGTARERWQGESGAITAIAAMGLAMNLGFLRTPLPARVPDAVVPAALLLAWLLSWTQARGRGERALRAAGAALVLACVGTATVTMADVRNEMDRAGILGRPGALSDRIEDLARRLSRDVPTGDQIPSRTSTALQPFFQYVRRCTAPSDRLVMTGLSPDVFVLADRGFAGGQMAFRPNFYRDPADQRRAIARMRRQSVPLFVLALEEEQDFRGFLGLVASYMEERYEPLVEVPVPGQRGLLILVERGRPSTGTDAATGWPCFVRPTPSP